MPIATQSPAGRLPPPHSLLVAICRRRATRSLDASRIESLKDPQFRGEFLNLAARHRVLGLTLSVLNELPALEGEPEKWGPAYRKLVRSLRRRAMFFEMKRDHVLGLLGDAGVQAVVLKGAAIAPVVYDDPSERDLEDLDLLVRKVQLKRSVRVLAAAGYVVPPFRELWAYRHHHFHIPVDHPDSHCVEIHWALGRDNAPFQLDSTTVFGEAVQLERPGLPALLVSRPEHTLLHMVLQNLQEGFSSLARLVDIDRILAVSPGFQWGTLAAVAHRGNMASPTALSFQLANRMLGTQIPEAALRDLRPAAVTRFHLAIMRPLPTLLNKKRQSSLAASQLLEFWLLNGIWQRLLLLGKMLMPDRETEVFGHQREGPLRRLLNFGKMCLFQVFLYVNGAAALATPSGRAQTRFWSSQASNSDRL